MLTENDVVPYQPDADAMYAQAHAAASVQAASQGFARCDCGGILSLVREKAPPGHLAGLCLLCRKVYDHRELFAR